MLTGSHIETVLRKIPGAYGRQVATPQTLADGANAALLIAPAGLTVKGAAAFLATMAQESASFRTTEEYAKNGRYAPYIGRTFEQITWRDNYAAFGRWCKQANLLTDADTFVKNPKSLADLKWAWLGGVWFWQARGIWAYGNRGDFLATQRAVNLGNPTTKATPNGIAARNAWYAAFLALGDALLPQPVTTPTAPTETPMVKYAPRHGKALADYAKGKVGTKYGQGWCQKFVNETAKTGSVGDWDGDKAADAEDGWKKAKAKGKVVLNDGDFKYDEIPPGVFHYWTGGSADHGHAAIGLGGRRIVGTDMTDNGPVYGKIGEADITKPRIHWGLTYVGYAVVEGNGYTLTDPPLVKPTTPKPTPAPDKQPTETVPPKPTVSLKAVVAAFKADSKRPQGGTTPGSVDDVKIVESALVAEKLLDKKYAGDGSAGSLTVKAYAAWQKKCGAVGKGVDGIPGKVTLTKLGAAHGFTVTT